MYEHIYIKSLWTSSLTGNIESVVPLARRKTVRLFYAARPIPLALVLTEKPEIAGCSSRRPTLVSSLQRRCFVDGLCVVVKFYRKTVSEQSVTVPYKTTIPPQKAVLPFVVPLSRHKPPHVSFKYQYCLAVF